MSPRLITRALNPALALAADADEVIPTHKIRIHYDHADPGGGGVNVDRVLHELGADTLAVLAVGGPSGRVLEELLTRRAQKCAHLRTNAGQLERAGLQKRPRIPIRARRPDALMAG